MATNYEYRVTTQQTNERAPETRQPGTMFWPWTHGSTTSWARAVGPRLPLGTVIRIERRRTFRRADGRGDTKPRGVWFAHRAYVVDASGIVRRTDRTVAQ